MNKRATEKQIDYLVSLTGKDKSCFVWMSRAEASRQITMNRKTKQGGEVPKGNADKKDVHWMG